MGLGRKPLYAIFCLMAAYVLAFVDRTILSLMLDPIRKEFQLSDAEVSLLAGFAFALLYAVLGLPMGRIADTSSRKRLIIWGIVGWSIATALCGAARNVTQLFLARVGVGVGEASLTPASYSMIGDLVPRERLGFAMSLYGIGATLGVGLAMALGGAIVQWAMTAPPMDLPLFGQLSGWRAAFVLAGVPGIPLAILFWLTVPEPARKVAGGAQEATFGQLLAHMRKHAGAFSAALLSYSLAAITIYAFVVWAPSYFFRVHGLKPVQVGLGLAVILGLGSSIGAIVGGFVSDALQRRGRNDAPALVIMVTQLICVPFLVTGYLASDATTAMVLLGTGMLILGAFGGCQHVTFQTMTPTRLRGQIGAVYLLATSMIGLSLGPFIIGLLTGMLGGPEKIAQSLAILAALVGPIAAGLLALALRSIRTAVAETTAGTA